MKIEEQYYDTRWRYDNHFKDDEMKSELIEDSAEYIQYPEQQNQNLMYKIAELESDDL